MLRASQVSGAGGRNGQRNKLSCCVAVWLVWLSDLGMAVGGERPGLRTWQPIAVPVRC